MNNHKKSQIKMFETVGILTVFFFLLIFGASFWYGIEKSTAKKDLSKAIQLRALQVGSRAVYMPELDCSFVGVQKDNCFDLSKAAVFQKTVKTDDPAVLILYYKVFENSKVSIREVYPPGNVNLTLYNNKPKGVFQTNTLQSPVLLYDANNKRYGFGILEVSAYATN